MFEEGYGWAIRSYGVRPDDEYLIIIEGHGAADEAPTEYYLNVTDDQGNELNHFVEIEDGGATADVQRAGGALLLGSLAFPSGEEPVAVPVGATLIAGALVIDAGAEIVDGEPAVTSQTIAGQATLGAEGETYEYTTVASAVSSTIETPVQMSSGQSYDDGREFGWQSVQNTPGLNNPSDVGQVLATATVAEQYGDYRVTIGENPNGAGHIALVIIGSTVVAATQVSTIGETIEEEREEEDEETDEDPEPEREEEVDDGPGTWERYRLSERQRVWLQRIGDFAFRAYSYYNQLRDDDDDPDGSCSLEAADIDMSVESQSVGRFPGSSSYTLFTGEFQATMNDVSTDYYCVHDREQFVQTYADDPSDLTDGSAGENVSVELMEERGYDVVWPADGWDEGDATEIGPDVIAYDDSTGEYVVVEAKTGSSTDAVGLGLLEEAYGERQLSTEWIEASLLEMERRSSADIDSSVVNNVITAIDNDNIRQEIVYVRDSSSSTGQTLTNPRRDSTDITNESVVGVDGVTIIELQAEGSSDD